MHAAAVEPGEPIPWRIPNSKVGALSSAINAATQSLALRERCWKRSPRYPPSRPAANAAHQVNDSAGHACARHGIAVHAREKGRQESCQRIEVEIQQCTRSDNPPQRRDAQNLEKLAS